VYGKGDSEGRDISHTSHGLLVTLQIRLRTLLWPRCKSTYDVPASRYHLWYHTKTELWSFCSHVVLLPGAKVP